MGGLQFTIATGDESLGEIGRKFDVGVYEMIEANPNLDPWEPKAGSTIVIPTEFVLPPGERKGIVINLAEMRLYFFHPDHAQVTTHPIGIGKKESKTPLGKAKIINKRENPSWTPPNSIREALKKQGRTLPAVMPPGPNNPLGEYSMRLSIPNYLIHGTNLPGGIGVRSTNGCIRLFPEDIKSLYPKIALETPVRLIHEPYKIGMSGDHVFLEAHQPLSEHQHDPQTVKKLLETAISAIMSTNSIDLDHVIHHAINANSYPVLIYSK